MLNRDHDSKVASSNLDEDTVGGADPGTDHDSGGRGEAEGAGAGNGQDGQGHPEGKLPGDLLGTEAFPVQRKGFFNTSIHSNEEALSRMERRLPILETGRRLYLYILETGRRLYLSFLETGRRLYLLHS